MKARKTSAPTPRDWLTAADGRVKLGLLLGIFKEMTHESIERDHRERMTKIWRPFQYSAPLGQNAFRAGSIIKISKATGPGVVQSARQLRRRPKSDVVSAVTENLHVLWQGGAAGRPIDGLGGRRTKRGRKSVEWRVGPSVAWPRAATSFSTGTTLVFTIFLMTAAPLCRDPALQPPSALALTMDLSRTFDCWACCASAPSVDQG